MRIASPVLRRTASAVAVESRHHSLPAARLAAVILAALILAFSVSRAALAGDSENIRIAKALSNAYAEVVDKVSPAVVGIEASKAGQSIAMSDDPNLDLFERFFDQLPFDFGPPRPRRSGPRGEQPQRDREYSIGCGVILDKEGHILTNNHVVADADLINVEISGKDGQFKAEIVGRDPNTDLAVIKLVNPPANLAVATIGDSDELNPGNLVIAIGSPMGYKQSVTTGVVSAKGRRVGQLMYERFIQTDAAINSGNSGGPLVNLGGEVVGLNTMIATRTGGSIGIGFAIPMNEARPVVRQLIDKGAVTRGYLGISMNPDDAEISRELGGDGGGALVADLTASGPAAKAGLKAGDLITTYDGVHVKNNEHLQYLVKDTDPGTEVPVEVLRDGQKVDFTIRIETQPDDLFARSQGPRGEKGRSTPESGSVDEEKAASLGMTVGNITDASRQRYAIDKSVTTGVVITKVESGGPADLLGLRTGMVIQEVAKRPVQNVEDFRRVLKENKDKDKLLLNVVVGSSGRYLLIKPSTK